MKRVRTASGVSISIRHQHKERDRAVILAPGFFQSKETKTFKLLEKDLSEFFDVIAMDFRGHGRSDGLYTFSAREIEDLEAVALYARERYKKLGVLGFSLGGSLAILSQAREPHFDSLVCVGSPMAFDEVEFEWWSPRAMALGLRGLELGAGFRPGNPYLPKASPIEVVNQIQTPIFFIHGDDDPTVFARHSDLLFEKAKAPKKILIWKNASHAEDIYRRYPLEFTRIVTEWFSQTLPK